MFFSEIEKQLTQACFVIIAKYVNVQTCISLKKKHTTQLNRPAHLNVLFLTTLDHEVFQY